MNTKRIIISSILVIGMVLSTIGTAAALPITIDGFVHWSNSTLCTTLDGTSGNTLDIVNNRTGARWNQSTPKAVDVTTQSGRYTLVLDDSMDNIQNGDVFYYYTTATDGSKVETNTTSATLSGVVLILNITLAAGAAPDLVVDSISLNPNCISGHLFGNESNEICAVIKNIGTLNAPASNASFAINGIPMGTYPVSALAPSATDTVCITDTTLRNAGDVVTINVTADCDDDVSESASGELNNESSQAPTVENNGYKGKYLSGGPNMTTWKTYDGSYQLIYSAGTSYYASGSGGWTHFAATWNIGSGAGNHLFIPGSIPSSVKEARLYVPYCYAAKDAMPDGTNPGNYTMEFNSNPKTPDAHYWDNKLYDDLTYPNYGMLVYNVTADLISGVNDANLTSLWAANHSGHGGASMRGMELVVVYEDGNEPHRMIFINEEFDFLYGGSSKCTTPAEATAWAPLTGSLASLSGPLCARLITFAPGANPDEGDLIVNGQVYQNEWNFDGPAQIGVSDRDVTNDLQPTNNLVGFRSDGDWMEACNAFLVVSEMKTVATSEANGYWSVGTNGCNITNLTAVDTIPNAPRMFPYGLISFDVTNVAPGGTVTVTLNLTDNGGAPIAIPIGTQYWEVNTTAGNNTWYQIPMGSDDGDSVVTIQLTDGGVGDHDGEVNGRITDPGGLGFPLPQIWIDQPDYVDPQSQFTINVTVDPQGEEISAVQYDLYYNTSVVWAEWANPGPFLSQDGADTHVEVLEIDNTWDVPNHVGRITYAETTLAPGGSGDLPYVTDPGVLTTIHFSAIGVRNMSTYFNFSDVMMSDQDKDPVTHGITNCSVTIYDNIPPVANASSKYWVSNVASKFQCFAALCCCNSHGGLEDGGEHKGDEIVYVRWDFGDGQYGTSEGLQDCQKHHEYTSWNWNELTEEYDPFIAYLTVRDDGEPQLSNTTQVEVMVYIAGDTNNDGVVDILDAACVGKHYGQSNSGEPDVPCGHYWTDPQADMADLNNDNRVTTNDLMIVGTNWNHLAYPPYIQD